MGSALLLLLCDFVKLEISSCLVRFAAHTATSLDDGRRCSGLSGLDCGIRGGDPGGTQFAPECTFLTLSFPAFRIALLIKAGMPFCRRASCISVSMYKLESSIGDKEMPGTNLVVAVALSETFLLLERTGC